MPTYIGFSTKNANKPRTTNAQPGVDGGTGSTVNPINYGKKFRMVDEQLIIQDFINALNIPQGQKVGKPSYGTTLWSFVFEPNTADVQFQLQDEIRRVAKQDPRLIINLVKAYPRDNGILIEIELAIAPFNNAQLLNVFFDSASNSAIVQ